jgi:hypothetical protein
MPRQLESKTERDTADRAQMELGIECVKLKARSWPDKMFMIPGGRPFLIEFKRKGESLRKNQQLKVWRLQTLGYDVEVHDDAEEAVKAIKERVKNAPVDKRSKNELRTAAIRMLRGGQEWMPRVDRAEVQQRIRKAESLEKRRGAPLSSSHRSLPTTSRKSAKR